METPKLDLYLGKVRGVVDRQTYEITADIPGVAEEVRAYPFSRGEMDEPVAGNIIYLISVDPVFHSFYLYTKAKENDFVGIRSNGKLIDLTPDGITIGVYPEGTTSSDEARPTPDTSFLKMDNSGNIEIMATGDEKIKISGNATIEVTGDVKLTANKVNIEASGECEVKSPKVTITGGQLTTKGQANMDMNGPYNCIKICPFTSSPHSGSIVSST